MTGDIKILDMKIDLILAILTILLGDNPKAMKQMKILIGKHLEGRGA